MHQHLSDCLITLSHIHLTDLTSIPRRRKNERIQRNNDTLTMLIPFIKQKIQRIYGTRHSSRLFFTIVAA